MKCLLPSHVKKDCRNRRNCYICRSWHHHTAICDRQMDKYDGDNNQISHEEIQTHHINAKVSVLLQTTEAEIGEVVEKYEYF